MVVDRELDAYVRNHCVQSGTTVSQVVRDALRAYFNATESPMGAGWREGYTAAYRTVMETVRSALAQTPIEPPSATSARGRAVAGNGNGR